MSLIVEQYTKSLTDYTHPRAAKAIAGWIVEKRCNFRISRPRATKAGDYRPPFKGQSHSISVNADLNPHAFFLTCAHEFAHLLTWEQYGGKVKPHGEEWKQAFRGLVKPFLDGIVFPADVERAIIDYMEDPKASSCSDGNLNRVLSRYNAERLGVLTVEDVEQGQVFALGGGRRFVKGSKLRKNYLCREEATGKQYRVNAHALCVLVVNGELQL